MTSAVAPSTFRYVPAQAERINPNKSETFGRAPCMEQGQEGDTLSISAEALAKLKEESSPAGTSPWETKYGYRNGKTSLKNGNSQVVTIKDNLLTVQEYSGGDLVREENAEITANGLTREITLYDKHGKVTQTMHSTLQKEQASGSNATSAILTRSAQWFENGVLVRDMQDSMGVKAEYDDAEGLEKTELLEPDDLESLKKLLPTNDVTSQYNATISEYANGKISKTATIAQGLHSLSISNRGDLPLGPVSPHSSWEYAGESSLSITMTTFDSSNRVASQAQYTDDTDIGVERRRHLSMITYVDGKIATRSEGEIVTKKSVSQSAPKQPMILDALGIGQDEFAASTPLTAQDMLSLRFMESSSKPDYYPSRAMTEKTSGGDRSAHVERSATTPYSIQWNTEAYVDGKLVVRQRDTEKASENPRFSKENVFAPGKGLTEDENPPLLRGSGHEVELYKDGMLSLRKRSEMQEELGHDERGVTVLGTRIRVDSGTESPVDGPWGVRLGGLEKVDADAEAASLGFTRNLAQMLTSVQNMVKNGDAEATV